MNIRRTLQNAFEAYRSAKTNQDARAIWSTVAAVLFSLFRTAEWTVPTWQFLGRAAEPEATGTLTVNLQPGLALWYDVGETDEWTGQLKPVFMPQTIPVAFDVNQDASGLDRVDLICVRPVLVAEYETDPATGANLETWFKDPSSGAQYKAAEHQRERWAYEYQIVKGAPDAAPVAPDTPAGWVAVAEITRIHSSAVITADHINDVRPRGTGLDVARLRADYVDINYQKNTDGGVVWHGPDGEYSELLTEGNARSLFLATDLRGVVPDGNLGLGTLTAWAELISDTLQAVVADRVTVKDAAGDVGEIRAKNTIRASATFVWADPGATYPDGLAATVEDNIGVASVTYRTDGVDKWAEITLSEPLPTVAGFPTFHVLGGTDQAGASIDPPKVHGYVHDTTTIRMYLTDEAGAFIEPDGTGTEWYGFTLIYAG